jgi:putative PIN family toxin of toxin-antitoxin system
MPATRIWAVFDCNIYLQALLNPNSPAAACFELARARRIVLCVSPQTLEEIREVLNRPFVFKLLPHTTPEMIQAFLEEVAHISRRIRYTPTDFAFSRDPKDEPYINLAIAAGADYIVTSDKDLLDLMTAYTDEAKEFRQRFRPLKVVDPVAFLREIENSDE